MIHQSYAKFLRVIKRSYENRRSLCVRRLVVNSAVCFGLSNDEKRSYRGNPDCANPARRSAVDDKKVDLTGVKVVSSRGTVYLSGTVQSLDARQQAVKIAWNAPGVQSVINALKVQK